MVYRKTKVGVDSEKGMYSVCHVLADRPIVHRAGGMLLQAKKEFVICAELVPEDVFFYYTTTYVS